MSIKKITTNLIFVLVLLMLCISCSKYDDPLLSLRSKNARVEGNYTVDKIETNPEIYIPNYASSFNIDFQKHGGGEMIIAIEDTTINSNFQWEFSDDKSKLRIRRYLAHPDYYQYLDTVYMICFGNFDDRFFNNRWGAWGNMMEIKELSDKRIELDYFNDSTEVQTLIRLTE